MLAFLFLKVAVSRILGFSVAEPQKGIPIINCLIVRFKLHDGVAESKKMILLDTTNVRALGEGSIDLRDETIDIKVHLHAKKRRFIELTTPFAIEGPLASPSVKVSSVGATARMVEEVLLTPINRLGSLLRLVNDHGKDAKNPWLTLQDGRQGQ